MEKRKDNVIRFFLSKDFSVFIRVQRNILEITEEEWKLEDKYLRLVELKKNEEQICSLDNPRYRRVLRMHIIDGLTWQVIAERLNVTERHAYYLSRKAHDELLTLYGQLNYQDLFMQFAGCFQEDCKQ